MKVCGLVLLFLLMVPSAFAQDSLLQSSSVQNSGAQNPPAGSGAGANPEQTATTPPLDLTPDANGTLSQEQMRALTRVVAQNYRDNYKKLRDYTYIDREVTRKLDG